MTSNNPQFWRNDSTSQRSLFAGRHSFLISDFIRKAVVALSILANGNHESNSDVIIITMCHLSNAHFLQWLKTSLASMFPVTCHVSYVIINVTFNYINQPHVSRQSWMLLWVMEHHWFVYIMEILLLDFLSPPNSDIVMRPFVCGGWVGACIHLSDHLSVALCHVGKIQTTVFAPLLINFTCVSC